MENFTIQKVAYFTHFDQKNTHISRCKIVYKCTSATVTVHICTVIVALLYIILIIYNFAPFFLSLLHLQNKRIFSPSSSSSSFDTHTPTVIWEILAFYPYFKKYLAISSVLKLYRFVSLFQYSILVKSSFNEKLAWFKIKLCPTKLKKKKKMHGTQVPFKMPL